MVAISLPRQRCLAHRMGSCSRMQKQTLPNRTNARAHARAHTFKSAIRKLSYSLTILLIMTTLPISLYHALPIWIFPELTCVFLIQRHCLIHLKTLSYLTYRLLFQLHVTRAFSAVGPSVWNGLPLAQRLLPRVHYDTFYSSLQTVLFSRAGIGSASE